MRIAIIGTGISGLVAAHRLYPSHELTLFESNAYVGGHTNTVDVQWQGERHAVDTGFIVFNDWTYPNFIGLLRQLGIASQPTRMSFSVRDDRTGLEYCGSSPNALFAQRRNLCRPSFYRMLADIARFNRDARQMIGSRDRCTAWRCEPSRHVLPKRDVARPGRPSDEEFSEMTVGDFLRRRRYSTQFAEHYLLPMGAAIWSCPTGRFADFPIGFIAEFYHNHGLLNLLRRPTWRVVTGGSRTYVRAMIEPFRHRIRLNSPVERVLRQADRVEVILRNGHCERFDHVIFACHSDQALRMLGAGATPTERELLGAFPYSRNLAVLHTDTSLLPHNRRAWASWNYRVSGRDSSPATVTYNLNILQGIRSHHTFCVTLNDDSRIAPERVLGAFEYHHPVFTVGRTAAQARHVEVLSANRSSFCGAYWRNGFHEDGAVSAMAVVDAIERMPSLQPRPLSLVGEAS